MRLALVLSALLIAAPAFAQDEEDPPKKTAEEAAQPAAEEGGEVGGEAGEEGGEAAAEAPAEPAGTGQTVAAVETTEQGQQVLAGLTAAPGADIANAPAGGDEASEDGSGGSGGGGPGGGSGPMGALRTAAAALTAASVGQVGGGDAERRGNSALRDAERLLGLPIAAMVGPSAVRRDQLVAAARQVSNAIVALDRAIDAADAAAAREASSIDRQIREGHAGPPVSFRDGLRAEARALRDLRSRLRAIHPRLVREANWYHGRAQGPSIGAPRVPPLDVRLFGPGGAFWEGLNAGGGTMLPGLPGPGVHQPVIPRPPGGGFPGAR